MIKEKVFKTIREHNLIQPNQHIVTGLSGGPDSVCLFHILLRLKEEMNLSIYPVHINHKFRPGAAEEDQLFVESLCRENGCTCRSYEVDCNKIAEEKRISSEEAGRLVRYRAFAEVCQELKDKGIRQEDIKIAVAQNADDQAETILFRILRGTGTDGLAGIKYKRKDSFGNEIIRPVLDITRNEIEDYCEKYNLTPRIDKSNLEPVYTRNKIRLNLIPYLEKTFNSGIKDTLVRIGRNAGCDSDFIWSEAEKIYSKAIIEKEKTSVMLKGCILREIHPAVRQRVLSRALSDIGINDDIGAVHFEGCTEIIFNEKPSARFDLPGGGYITKVYENIKIAKEVKAEEIQISAEVLSIEEFNKREKIKDMCAAFDYDELSEAFGEDFLNNISLRTRKPGDYIALSATHTKKLQNYFVDKKIPKDRRDSVNILSAGSEVLWILPGKEKGRYSGRYKLCPDTKKVFFIEIISKI